MRKVKALFRSCCYKTLQGKRNRIPTSVILCDVKVCHKKDTFQEYISGNARTDTTCAVRINKSYYTVSIQVTRASRSGDRRSIVKLLRHLVL